MTNNITNNQLFVGVSGLWAGWPGSVTNGAK